MIIDKAIISAVRTGQMTKKELVNELLRSNNVMENFYAYLENKTVLNQVQAAFQGQS